MFGLEQGNSPKSDEGNYKKKPLEWLVQRAEVDRTGFMDGFLARLSRFAGVQGSPPLSFAIY